MENWINLRIKASFDDPLTKFSHAMRTAAAAMTRADPLTTPLFNGGSPWVSTPIYDSMFDD